ncbi:MAG: hypothetical protein HYW48_08760 [Deltaproteobacteria bacterium]|nr:hypothetical protein [Deltaproteobacteria bacterium]
MLDNPRDFFSVKEAVKQLGKDKDYIFTLGSHGDVSTFFYEELFQYERNEKNDIRTKTKKRVLGYFQLTTNIVANFLLSQRRPQEKDLMPSFSEVVIAGDLWVKLDSDLKEDPKYVYRFGGSAEDSLEINTDRSIYFLKSEIKAIKDGKGLRSRDKKRATRIDKVENERSFFEFVVLAMDRAHRAGVLDKFYRNGKLSVSALLTFAETNPYQSASVYNYDLSEFKKGHDRDAFTRRVRELNTKIEAHI